ncbi:hypothetical protein LCGC14_0406420 [marine sediment metagenome]|uniref:Uncharacterized protein n=1 Tax=marine sediment metagenome TaxID=412755 RepID=A0A0F9W4H6_9ZZZZ
MDEPTDGVYKKVSLRVDEWFLLRLDERFTFDDIARYYDWRERETRDALSKKLYYETTKQQPKLKKRDRFYQVIDRDYDILNFKHANPGGWFDIKYPFGLEEYVKTPRRSVIIFGGSPQAGKTAIAHNIVDLNWKKHKIVLFDTENSEAELYERLSQYSNFQEWPDDLIRSKSFDFADVGEPDALNIIDYLESPENIWEIRTLLRELRDMLTTGIWIVMLQKPEGRDLPYGKDWAKQLPRMVVSMEGGILKILKGKSWVDRDVNPDGLRWSFKLVGGEKFVNIMPLGKEEG